MRGPTSKGGGLGKEEEGEMGRGREERKGRVFPYFFF